MHIIIEGTFDYEINPGKAAAPMYTIGRPRDLTGLKNATLKIDGNCLDTKSVDIRENPDSNRVIFINCEAAESEENNILNLERAEGTHYNKIKLFPNPPSSIMNVEGISDQSRFEIRDISGKIVRSRLGSGQMIVSTLLPSVYITFVNGVYTSKVIIR